MFGNDVWESYGVAVVRSFRNIYPGSEHLRSNMSTLLDQTYCSSIVDNKR